MRFIVTVAVLVALCAPAQAHRSRHRESGSALVPCPQEGDGNDSELNKLKNRATEPDSFRQYTVADFLASFPALNTSRSRAHFTAEQRREVEPREKEGVSLIGYLLAAKQSGPESCNCHDPTRRDFHVWISPDRPTATLSPMKFGAVVVEPTPWSQDQHPTWRLHTLQHLAKDGAKVRISGWALFDPEHPDQIGQSRATIWEVHPVTKIEVWNAGRWDPL